MTKKISGEVSIKLGGKSMALRLDAGTILDLEDHFDVGFIHFMENKFAELRLGDLSVLVMSMTDRDYNDRDLVKAVAGDIVDAGIVEVVTLVSKCIENTLMVSDEKQPGK